MKNENHSRKNIIRAAAAAVCITLLILAVQGVRHVATDTVSTAEGLVYIENAEAQDLYDIDDRIQLLDEAEESYVSRSVKEMFSGSVVLGDSQAAALLTYDVLYASNVAAAEGAAPGDCAALLDAAAEVSPKNIILAFGTDVLLGKTGEATDGTDSDDADSDLAGSDSADSSGAGSDSTDSSAAGTDDTDSDDTDSDGAVSDSADLEGTDADEAAQAKALEEFISDYKALISEIREKYPDTHIFICSVLYASDDAAAKYPALSLVEEYNTELIEMCDTLQIGYIDNDTLSIWSEHAQDGIYFPAEWYVRWADNIAETASL